MTDSQKDWTKLILGAGVSKEQLRTAIESSGYPLQTFVSHLLREANPRNRRFHVEEEWSFVDRDTRELRSIDLLASMPLYDRENPPRVRPILRIIGECKKSDLPYVFFESLNKTRLNNFPAIAGIHTDKLRIQTDDESATYLFPLAHTLSLLDHSFYSTPVYCHSFSRCARSGKKLSLSGSDAYSSLVLPLVKAVHHFVRSHAPTDHARYFDCDLVIACAVIDAPIVRVQVESGDVNIMGSGWIRVIRHEYDEDVDRFDRNQLRVIEVVHKDFFTEYLEQHLIPFAINFSERALAHVEEIATGEAFVPGMKEHGTSDLEKRLNPISAMPKRDARTERFRKLLRED